MKWKCKQTGNIIDLPEYEDANMVGHDGYEKVEDAPEADKTAKQPKAKKEQAE